MHQDRARLNLVKDEVQDEGLDVAVENESDDFALGVDAGTARVAPDDILIRDEVQRRVERRATLFFRVNPGLSEIERIASSEIRRRGFDYPVTAQIGEMYFNTRCYDDFTMPAGRYDALRLTIGDGEGQNWWCVMYPSLCVGAASETEMEDHLVDGEYEVVTADKYDFRFKLVEYWEGFRLLFR